MLEPNGLATELQAALPGAWQTVKNAPFPGDPNDPDQKILFLAIARGLLKYLDANQNGVMSAITLTTGGSQVTSTVTSLDLNITGV